LYSVCARFSDRVRYPNKEAVMTELFGSRGGAATIALPTRLNYLASNLPSTSENWWPQFVDRLIEKHTLLPLYSPFLPVKRVQEIRVAMGSSDNSTIHNKAGI